MQSNIKTAINERETDWNIWKYKWRTLTMIEHMRDPPVFDKSITLMMFSLIV